MQPAVESGWFNSAESAERERTDSDPACGRAMRSWGGPGAALLTRISGARVSRVAHESEIGGKGKCPDACGAVVGHVNNAAVWQAVTEVVTAPVTNDVLTHHGAIAGDDDVVIAHVPGSLWMVVDGQVRVAAQYTE